MYTRISTKNRIAIIFSIFSTGIILILSIIFAINVFLTLKKRIETEMYTKYLEITNAYIDLYSQELKINDLEIDALKKVAQIDQVSLIIYDKNKNILGSYGDFIVKAEIGGNKSDSIIEIENKDRLEIYMDSKDLDRAVNSSFIDTATAIDGKQFRVFSGPIINTRGNTIGIIQIAKEDSTFNELMISLIMGTLLAALFINILSISISKILSNKILEPLTNTTNELKNIELNTLHKRITKPNVPHDDPLNLITVEFNTLLDRLEKANSKQKNFISNASHELKTPLAVINSSIDLLDSENTPAERKSQINLIRKEIKEMKTLIEDLLFLSKLEDKYTIDKPAQTRISEVLNEIVDKYKKQITDKKLDIHTQGDQNIPINKEYLKTLLDNLISNAIKYSYAKGRIEIITSKKENTFNISISDTGIGIAESDIEKIFDRFYRGESSFKMAKGNGLGLSIVKEICELHELSLEVTSKENEGTTISITGKDK